MTSTPASPPPPIAEPCSIERGSTNPMSCDAEPGRAGLPPRREEVAR